MPTHLGNKYNLFLPLLLVLTWSCQTIAMQKPITLESVLDNGLKVVVREDHRAPVVVVQIWYRVGSADEHEGTTGISHALEHMMFQGTPNLPNDGFAQLISQYGGHNNAFTTEDYTAYYEELDAANLEISLNAEADRMTNLVLSKEAFDKEIQVVIEERRLRTDDNPQSITWERFMTMANLRGPYHHPVIGWQVDLDQMNIEDIRQWYKNWYAPNNATIVIVGDVKAQDAIELVKKHFGAIGKRELPKSKMRRDLIPLGQRQLEVKIPAKLPVGLWGFNVPSLKTSENAKEVYALIVASSILDGGESARFPRFLIRKSEIAASVNTYYDPFKRFGTQFVISGIPANTHTVKELGDKIFEQIELLKTQLVSEDELERVKNQILAQEVFEKDSMSEQATLLGMLESIGLHWQLADEFTSNVRKVTANEIQAAAQKYFTKDHMTHAQLIPQPFAFEEIKKKIS